MNCKELKIYDPINIKCVGENTKRGRELKRLIKVCKDNSSIDTECKAINKVYKTKIMKLKQIVKNALVPVLSVIAFNILIYAAFSTPSIRNRLLSFVLKRNKETAPYADIMAPIITTLPAILTFVVKYGDLARLAILGASPGNIIAAIDSVMRIHHETPLTIGNLDKMADDLAGQIIILPGGWPETPQDVPPLLQKEIKAIDNSIDKSLKTDKTNTSINFLANFATTTLLIELSTILLSVTLG